MLIFRLLKESFDFALQALIVNKLRTILSLLGITVGIFAIITVYSAVDSLEANIRNSVSSLGNNVVYVQKMPWGGGGEYKWWKYINRPEPKFTEFELLQKKMKDVPDMAFLFGSNETVKYRNNSADNVTIFASTHKYDKIWDLDLGEGRYFTENESRSGSAVGIIGVEVVQGLFPDTDPIGKEIKLLGRKVTIIGVFNRQGKSMTGQNFDEMVLVPANFLRTLMNLDYLGGGAIMVKVPPGWTMDQLKDELSVNMRAVRRLSPRQDENFALNEMSLISSALDGLFSTLGIIGTVIGGFSILVGGFGIANIMFVSVKERTTQIGIQKSLGAKRIFILLQFLFEAVILCLFGGVLGLILVFILIKIAAAVVEFDFFLSVGNIVWGLGISAIIGLISGFLPALSASLMNPVDAIRANT
ncbi:MAG: ABC transporter permease [Schleiferiaceae bacterium]